MNIEHTLIPALAARGLTLATAESCTGGLIAKRITDVPGASAVYLGSVVSYANEVKTGLLGVDPDTLAAHGAVSAENARTCNIHQRHAVPHSGLGIGL
ncbi:MAG: nicotinamide-nucleotide amidohydrolase family protein, partial [Clostridia bacterium]|nr:nicotinamide-nucleotide amidohydrolase family protein [Clostridia bacterium]